MCDSNRLLHGLIYKVKDSGDILTQAVAVETLSQLVLCNHGYKWLVRQEVMGHLMHELSKTEEEHPFCALIQPGNPKSAFIAAIARGL